MSASTLATPLEASPLRLRPVALLTLGHLFVDLCQGLVPALVPYLVVHEGFSLSAATGLLFATSALSSIVQPIFGRLADQSTIRGLLPLSILAAGAALALGAQFSLYPVLLLALTLSGLGIAAFHPEAARRTFLSAGAARTTAMSYFSLGGSVGFAVAPILGSALLLQFGRSGFLLIVPLALIVATLLAFEFHEPIGPRKPKTASTMVQVGTDNWSGFWRLSVSVIARSVAFFGINSLLVLFWTEHWGQDTLSAGTAALSVFLFSGIAGTLLGGWLADRVGRRTVMGFGFGISTLLFPLVFVIPNMILSLVVLGLMAAAFFASSSPAVVLGQEYLPNRVGVASGLTIGLAVSTGGMVAPLLGQLGDYAGLPSVFMVIEGLLAICFVSVLFLPPVHPTTR